MGSRSIEERVIDVVVEHFGDKNSITRETSFVGDLGADSLDSTEVIMELEEEFSEGDVVFKVSDADADKLLTVGNAIDHITEKLLGLQPG